MHALAFMGAMMNMTFLVIVNGAAHRQVNMQCVHT